MAKHQDSSSEDNIYFNINTVAKKIGVVPATIRNWEKQGLFVARRSANGYRIYDFKDLDTLQSIKQLSKDENMGINAIRMMYKAQPYTEREVAVSRRLLSEKWRESRQKRGDLLDDVAKAVGISPSYLSKIENGQANVSLEVLESLAKFYGESLMYYVGEPESESHIVRKNQGETFTVGVPGVTVESVVALSNSPMNAMVYTIEPGSGRSDVSIHSGQEYVYLLSGRMEFVLDEADRYTLDPGDSLCYPSHRPHTWMNIGKRTAKVLWVYTHGPE
ncbi:MAG: helix-turn-helix domain-containing protein [Oscillospiraceae bacterium]|nr:helix-turn-helix domain-containing protein [Oscillospiraceae bacterium]